MYYSFGTYRRPICDQANSPYVLVWLGDEERRGPQRFALAKFVSAQRLGAGWLRLREAHLLLWLPPGHLLIKLLPANKQ